MVNRIDWKEVPTKPARSLSTKIDVRIDLAPPRPGERTEFEKAMRVLFPGGWTRQQARWFAQQAIRGVSRAVMRDGKGMFPMDVALVWPPEREVGTLKSASSTVMLVDFRRG